MSPATSLLLSRSSLLHIMHCTHMDECRSNVHSRMLIQLFKSSEVRSTGLARHPPREFTLTYAVCSKASTMDAQVQLSTLSPTSAVLASGSEQASFVSPR